VQIEVSGDRGIDEDRANAAARFDETPDEYTWHHVEDGRTMELVPFDLHSKVHHTGGVAAVPAQVGEVAPGGVLTTGERAAGAAGAGAGAAAGPAAAEQGGAR